MHAISGTFDSWTLPGFPTISIRDNEVSIGLVDSIRIEDVMTEGMAVLDTASTAGDLEWTHPWPNIEAGQHIILDMIVFDPPGILGVPPHGLPLKVVLTLSVLITGVSMSRPIMSGVIGQVVFHS